MTCSACGKENAPDSRFCIFCGASLSYDPPSQEETEEREPTAGQADEAPADAQLASIGATVASIREELNRLVRQVSEVEAQLRAFSPPTQPSRPQASAVGPMPHATVAVPAVGPPPSAPPASARFPVGEPPWRGVLDNISRWDWDWLIGGNWLARIGIVALVIGAGFFLKLAFDNDWIGETGRVVLGIVAGLALLGGGEYWQRRYPIWAQPLTGGGIAMLYLSIFAAFSLYDLIPSVAAFGFFFLVTLAAAGLALKYESMTIAILGIVGGFITPLLLRDKLPDERLLIAYVLVLDLGVLGLATFRNWRWFTLLGLAGSLGLFWFWYDQLAPSVLLAQLGITFIFLIFMGATTLLHILWRRAPGPADQSLMVLNAAAYFGISYGLLFDEFRPWMGGFTLLIVIVVCAPWVRSPDEEPGACAPQLLLPGDRCCLHYHRRTCPIGRALDQRRLGCRGCRPDMAVFHAAYVSATTIRYAGIRRFRCLSTGH